MKYPLMLALALTTLPAFAADRVASCTGAFHDAEDGVIRVHVMEEGDAQYKITLSEGKSNHNTWDTYHGTYAAHEYRGADAKGRELWVRVDGERGLLVKGEAPNEDSASGVTELRNIDLSCE
jgi:hypothetical protein